MGKKIFLASAFIVLISVSTLAQAKFMMGLKGGLNFSSVDVAATPMENYKSSTGYHGGLFATIKVAKIGVHAEALFSKQGYIKKTVSGEDLFDYRYVNIPIIVKWYILKGFNIQVGPQIDMLSSAVLVEVDGTRKDQVNVSQPKVWNLCAGIGIDLPFKMNIDARYIIGLTEVNNVTTATSAIKSRVIQVALGYRFLDKGN